MITFNIIGRYCSSRLDLAGLGIREAQVESVVNGIGIILKILVP